MFRHLSTFATLTVLRLTGQFCVRVDFFGALAAANPFPALRVFHIDIGPDTADAKWFFIKDETEQAWDKAAEDPEWTSYVKHVRQGIFRDDPESDWEPTSDDEGYYAYMEAKDDEYAILEEEEVKRNRTLPDDATMSPMLRGAAEAMGRMPKVEEFNVCLADNFDEDECRYPIVPPFITRAFELRFVKEPEGKSAPTLTFEIGQKITH
jgi:hypothetical protein